MWKKVVDRFYWYTPGDRKTFRQGLWWNWLKFTTVMPLLTMTRPGWWRCVWHEYKTGRTDTCACGRTWFTYRILPALVGDKRFGGGC